MRGIRRILAAVAFPTLREAGVGDELIDELVRLATEEQSYFLDVDPHDWTADEVRGAYREAFAITSR